MTKCIMELAEFKPYKVNPDFISPGELHVGLKNGKQNPDVFYIESVEVIGGMVFLGTRICYNEADFRTKLPTKDELKLSDTVLYENMSIFLQLQTFKSARARNDEVVEYNRKRAEEQAELKRLADGGSQMAEEKKGGFYDPNMPE